MSLLVVHGAKDCAVPVHHVRKIIEALRDKGAKLVYKEHAHSGHGELDWHNDLASWLKAQLKK
jgi:predicted esterase